MSNSSCHLVHDIDVVDVGWLRMLVAALGFRMLVGLGLRMLVADLVFRTVVAHKGVVAELVVVVLGIVLVLVEHAWSVLDALVAGARVAAPVVVAVVLAGVVPAGMVLVADVASVVVVVAVHVLFHGVRLVTVVTQLIMPFVVVTR